jgi:hypothetical protein
MRVDKGACLPYLPWYLPYLQYTGVYYDSSAQLGTVAPPSHTSGDFASLFVVSPLERLVHPVF